MLFITGMYGRFSFNFASPASHDRDLEYGSEDSWNRSINSGAVIGRINMSGITAGLNRSSHGCAVCGCNEGRVQLDSDWNEDGRWNGWLRAESGIRSGCSRV